MFWMYRNLGGRRVRPGVITAMSTARAAGRSTRVWVAALACVLVWGRASPALAQPPAGLIADLQALIVDLQAQIVALQLEVDANTAKGAANMVAIDDIAANSVLDLDGVLTLKGTTVRFAGVNVLVLNGLGATDSINGVGNLIVGYDEASPTSGVFEQPSVKTGSHNLVVGAGHTYTSWGGVVAGLKNEIAGPYATVTGGQICTASGDQASVAGGLRNVASGDESSVGGGFSVPNASTAIFKAQGSISP